jgi:hypothetical protein
MKIFRHKENKLLYTIDHLIHDLYHLNNNEFVGIHSYPYGHKCWVGNFYSKNDAECNKYVEETFDLVSDK